MKFFLDTANLDEIRQAAALGLCDGVTTNPTLVSKEANVDFKSHIAEICKIVSGPVSSGNGSFSCVASTCRYNVANSPISSPSKARRMRLTVTRGLFSASINSTAHRGTL